MKTRPLTRLLVLAVLCSVALLAPNDVAAQTDDFDDGDDLGWTKYDSAGTATFTFPNGGYRLQGFDTATEAQIICHRTNEYADCFVAMDILAWDTNSPTRAGYGLGFRMTDIGPGSTMGYAIYWTPAVSGGGAKIFGMVALITDMPFVMSATITRLDPARQYRMVASAAGDLLEGRIYDLADLTKPVAYIASHDSYFPSGKCGVFALSRGSLTDGTNFDITIDNYYAAATPPATVAAPGTPHPIAGTPQVVNRVPESNKNLHPPASGISFTATTFGGNALASIQLFLNGTDVSGALSLSGPANNRSATYTGLTSNQVYQARIVLVETGGKASTNEFQFDTFSDGYLTSAAVKLVEAEDYNASGGQYQNDPLPSGLNSSAQQVNGNGVGYYGLAGTSTVDFTDTTTSIEPEFYGWSLNAYRYVDPVATVAGALYYLTESGNALVLTNDTALSKFAGLGLPDYHARSTKAGEWLNYTRQFTAGPRHVFLRLSSIAAQEILFDEVTSDRTLPGQTTTNLGKFVVVITGHPSTFRYFQLVDGQGRPVVLEWSGEKTFRLTMGGVPEDTTKDALQMNYLMFVPAPPAQPAPFSLLNPLRNGGTFSVSFPTEPTFTYTLRYKNALTDATWLSTGATVAGDGTVKTLQDTSGGTPRFYRVSAQ